MDSLLKELNMLPGVFGCFIYSGSYELMAAKLPPIFKEKTIKTIGNLLSRTFKMSARAHLGLTAMEVKFDGSKIVGKSLPQGALLVLICEPAVNMSLINMTIAMLMSDIQSAVNKNPGQVQPLTPESGLQPPGATTEKIPKRHEIDIDTKLALILEDIKEALAYAIGPIAGQVMRDLIETWAQHGATCRQRLPALATLLCQEINDKELETAFMRQVRPLF